MIERTLVIVKPDGVKRNLVDEILKRYTDAGLKIVARKTVTATKELAEKHYTDSEEQIVGMGNKTLAVAGEDGTRKIFGTNNPREIGMVLRGWSIEFLISGPVVAVVLEGEDTVEKVRKITGFTDPSKAEKGTIRGDLGDDSILKANEERRATRNLIHAAGNKEEAGREIKLWFD